mmetsp:Transcript_9990/g.11931  ORF Transcript_9990/g.11931 Transcript_9990/m.11931 type:complete len:80 (+) Transcript_9990:196-435(+)
MILPTATTMTTVTVMKESAMMTRRERAGKNATVRLNVTSTMLQFWESSFPNFGRGLKAESVQRQRKGGERKMDVGSSNE